MNVEFWNSKIEGTVERDKRNNATLKEMGWQILVVWGCEIKRLDLLVEKLKKFLLPEI